MGKKRVLILVLIVILSLAVITLLIISNNNVKVSFDCGDNCTVKAQYIKKNKKAAKPEEPKLDGMVFVEWQLDGKSYNFDKKVSKNITLKAKWLPEKYVKIEIEKNNGEDVSMINVLAGTSLSNSLEKPVREGYIFNGWYINEKEYDLNKKVTTNIKLTAKWQLDENSGLKIGDKVLIIGNYSEASFATVALHSAAIGWEREIISIYEDAEFPYAVGNESGITGYFKDSSLEKIN